jgi:hypothetical protein
VSAYTTFGPVEFWRPSALSDDRSPAVGAEVYRSKSMRKQRQQSDESRSNQQQSQDDSRSSQRDQDQDYQPGSSDRSDKMRREPSDDQRQQH